VELGLIVVALNSRCLWRNTVSELHAVFYWLMTR
jgi:hypothetical protein